MKKLSDVETEFGNIIIALCFASQLPDVIEHITKISEKHETLVPVSYTHLIMECIELDNKIKITDVHDLDLAQTLDCGQSFRWKPQDDGSSVSYTHLLRQRAQPTTASVCQLFVSSEQFFTMKTAF